MTQSLEDRFMAKVRKDASGCWLWTAKKNRPNGYGQFRLSGRMERAHRVAYELFVGPIPEGLHVCHTCDVSDCVNPLHLFVGTHHDNMHDMAAKGRQRSPNAKLTPNQVREIRRRYASGGVLQRELAAEFGVKRRVVGQIVHRQRWGRVLAEHYENEPH